MKIIRQYAQYFYRYVYDQNKKKKFVNFKTYNRIVDTNQHKRRSQLYFEKFGVVFG